MAPGSESGDAPTPWRSALSWRLSLLVLTTFALGLVPIALGIADPFSRALFTGVDLTTVAALAGTLHPRVPWRVRSGVLVAVILACGSVGVVRVGLLAGPAVLLVTSLVVAALLFGRPALLVVLAAVLAVTLATAIGVTSGTLPAPEPSDVSMELPRVWLRTSAVTLLGMASLGYVVLWVVSTVEASLGRMEAESAERLEAERARAQAERAAAAAQKLEMVAQLAAGLGHDFNNHLTVIGLYNGQLARSGDDGVRAASEGIRTALDEASSVARQLLVLGRREVRSPRPLSLRALVEAYEGTLRRVLPSDVVVRVERDGDPWALVDEGQIHQVLLNLVVNARDAMPSGGELVVRTRLETVATTQPGQPHSVPPGEWAVLEVEDSGVGMDAATLARAGEPFFTTKEAGRGTGLGLSSAKHIAAQSQGRLALTSTPGQGTRAALWLPRVAPVLEPVPPPAARPRSLSGTTVLVAEDNADTLRLMTTVLAEAGCTVLTAQDGAEAAAQIDGHAGAIDLLCTDAVMPGTPIRALLERWAARHPGRPVLVCSGHVVEELARRGIEEGRYALLAKPFAPDALVTAVAQAIAGP